MLNASEANEKRLIEIMNVSEFASFVVQEEFQIVPDLRETILEIYSDGLVWIIKSIHIDDGVVMAKVLREIDVHIDLKGDNHVQHNANDEQLAYEAKWHMKKNG